MYHKRFLFGLQEPHFFRGTIAENIAWGMAGMASLQQVEEAPWRFAKSWEDRDGINWNICIVESHH